MNKAIPNPGLVNALRVPVVELTTKTVVLEADVNAGLDALKAEIGGSKQELVNKLLRAALFTDALSSVLAVQPA